MGAQGAGTPMKFLSGTQIMSYFTLKCIRLLIKIVFLRLCIHTYR